MIMEDNPKWWIGVKNEEKQDTHARSKESSLKERPNDSLLGLLHFDCTARFTPLSAF